MRTKIVPRKSEKLKSPNWHFPNWPSPEAKIPQLPVQRPDKVSLWFWLLKKLKKFADLKIQKSFLRALKSVRIAWKVRTSPQSHKTYRQKRKPLPDFFLYEGLFDPKFEAILKIILFLTCSLFYLTNSIWNIKIFFINPFIFVSFTCLFLGE